MPVLAGSEVQGNPVSDPLWMRSEFDEMVERMVAVSAPRLFAIVQEYGDAIDVTIVAWGMAFGDHVTIMAWGMAFGDHVEIVNVVDGRWLTLPNPESTVAWFGRRLDVTAHLVWADATGAGVIQSGAVTPLSARLRWCPWHGPFSDCFACCPTCPVRVSSMRSVDRDQC